MKTHTKIGHDILHGSPSHFLKSGAIIALGHHERFDGNGYPYGVAGTEIPVEARVAAVADVFDALQSERPYKKPWSIERTLEYMRQERGKHFDPECIDAFFNRLDQILSIRNQFSDETSHTTI